MYRAATASRPETSPGSGFSTISVTSIVSAVGPTVTIPYRRTRSSGTSVTATAALAPDCSYAAASRLTIPARPGGGGSMIESPSATATASPPAKLRAWRTASPSPSGRGWRVYRISSPGWASRSKWSSIASLPVAVTSSADCIPSRASSSITYCTTGRSTIGSISFGTARLAGSRRVPWPATGTTARVIKRRRALRRASASAAEPNGSHPRAARVRPPKSVRARPRLRSCAGAR